MISVILPVYNVEKYIDACLEALLQQTLEDFELIIVNDGSTDRSGEICQEWSKKDTRIRLIHQENMGLSEARNSGLRVAEGEYIVFIDSDDTVEQHFLQVLYENIVQNNAQVSICNFKYIWENSAHKTKEVPVDTQKENEITIMSGRDASSYIVKDNKRFMITAWGKMYHKSLSSYLYYPKGRTHEDEFTTYRVLYRATKVVVTMEQLYNYLQRNTGIMGKSFQLKRLDKIDALKEAITFFDENRDEEMKCYAVKRYLLNIQIAWYRVYKFLPSEKEVLLKLKQEWQYCKKEYCNEWKGCCGLMDILIMTIFAISPTLYAYIANIYIKIIPQD